MYNINVGELSTLREQIQFMKAEHEYRIETMKALNDSQQHFEEFEQFRTSFSPSPTESMIAEFDVEEIKKILMKKNSQVID